MILSEIGEHTRNCWMKIPEHFPFVKLDEFVVMPNHIHGIIVIDKLKTGITSGGDVVGGDAIVETQNFASLQNIASPQNFASLQSLDKKMQHRKTKNQFGPQKQNLASVIRGFKIGVTLFCEQNKLLFGWQPRYYDHIIRNKGEFERIQNYIQNNPINWSKDVHYSS